MTDHRAFLATLPAAEKATLTTTDDGAGLRHLLGHCGVLCVTGTLIALRVPFWPLLVPIHGVVLVFLFTLEHECTHRTPFRTARLNDGIGRLAGVLLVLPFAWFRAFHLAHHRYTNLPGRDPELASAKPETPGQWLVHVSGLPYWWGNIRLILRLAAGRQTAPYLSPRALPGMADRTLVVGSMSKSHAMTGSRCGWIVGPEEAIGHLINLATHTTYGVPGFIQDAASFALTAGDELEKEVAAPFRRRRALAMQVLARQNTVGLIPAQGAMYLMLDIRATGQSGEDFANALLDTHAIAVMPGESFGQAAAGHVRVAMTIDDDRFVAALETLCVFSAQLAGQAAAE